MYSRRIEDYKAPWEIKLEESLTIEDLLKIKGEVGATVKVVQWADTGERPGRIPIDEFYGVITEDHPRWIRILRKGAIGDYFTTILKNDLLIGKAYYHVV